MGPDGNQMHSSVKHPNPSARLEELVSEMRRLMAESQRYFAQRKRSLSDNTLHHKREQRIIEIRNELEKMLKAGGV
jgi:hypothetical protein